MADIFVSYARADKAFVERLVGTLEGTGSSLWWDREIVGGAEFAKTIEQEMAAARIVLVVWSPSSLESAWVKDEAGYGLAKGKLVPICLGGAEPPLGFRQIQAIDFEGWKGGLDDPCFRGLLQALPLSEPAPHPTATAPASAASSFGVPPKALVGGAAGLVVLMLAALLYFAVLPSGKAPAPTNSSGRVAAPAALTEDGKVSVAVLPFINMSGDLNNEYFSDGITEEILNGLVALDDLRVTSRTSSFAFKGSAKELPEIATALGVGHVLEGSVRKDGNQVRITVQLIRASDDAHLWSQTYDRELTQIFKIQEEISRSVAEALSVRLLGQSQSPAQEVNPVAYDHYLRGEALLETTIFSDVEKALMEFRAAQAADPKLAQAYAGEAAVLAFSASTGKEPPVPTLLLAEQAASKALMLDPNNAEAQAALGFIAFTRGQLMAAIDHWDKAEQNHGLGELDYWFFAHALCGAGQCDRAREMLEGNLVRDPYNAGIEFGLGIIFESLADQEAAFAHYDKALTLAPNNTYYIGWLAFIAATQQGDLPKGIRYLTKAVTIDPGDPEFYSILSSLYYSVGDDQAADEWLAKSFLVDPEHSHGRYLQAQYLYSRGDPAGAFKVLEAMRASGREMRFGAMRGVLTLLGKSGLEDEALIAAYYENSRALAEFDQTGHLYSVALVNTPATFLGVDLAAVLKRQGRSQEAQRLTDWAMSFLAPRQFSEFDGYQLVVAEALAIQGRDDEAMQAIEEIFATENVIGWQWRLRDNAHFDALKERPRFKQVLQTISERNAKARAELARDRGQ